MHAILTKIPTASPQVTKLPDALPTVAPAELDVAYLENAVVEMYTKVAEEPGREFHFELGRALCVRLGYPIADLDRIPEAAIESFAGVGYHFGLANLRAGERVLDLGSGSGTDAFTAALHVGREGSVIGVDMTDAQLKKARLLRNDRPDFSQVSFEKSYIESLPLESESIDCVVSNGVINLVPDKDRVFQEAARVLAPGGRLAISDIVTRVRLPESVVCDANLWAACIGGAMHRDEYQEAIEAAGLEIQFVKVNDYQFLPGRADRSATKFGVISVSLLAVKK